MRRIFFSVSVIIFLAASASGQIIQTIAGGAVPNNIPATTAWLTLPSGVATDNLGNLYITTEGQSLVLQVNSEGSLSVVAGNGTVGYSGDGGPATSASMVSPGGVAVDSFRNLFIADVTDGRIRRVDAKTGTITTAAGNGTYGFSGDGGPATAAWLSNYVSGVAVDAAGDLFIADTQNDRIRRVDGKTSIITTVAGGGTSLGDGGPATSATLSFPEGVAVDTSGNIFIADTSDLRIRRVDVGTGIITTVAGNGQEGFDGKGDGGLATKASFVDPVAVWVDVHGNIFIADDIDERVRRVDGKTGIITTVAGNSNEGFTGDGGLATSASLSYPESVTVDASGNILIADNGNQRVRRVDAVTRIITTLAGNATPGDGEVATTAGLAIPNGLALDASGNVFIADFFDYRIRQVDAETAIISTVAGDGLNGYTGEGDGGPATSASISPYGVALDAASGDIFISEFCLVFRVDAGTGIITTAAGNLYACGRFSGDGGPATSAGLDNLFAPDGIAVDKSGNLFIPDTLNQRIRRVDAATGIITTVAGNGTYGFSGDGGPATSASLSNPFGVTVDGSGNLFIADTGNNRIRRVDAVTGIITTVAGSGSIQRFSPFQGHSWGSFSPLQRHSREGGNPFGPLSDGLELVQERALSLAWIPAFAGMTRFRRDDTDQRVTENIKLTVDAAAGDGAYDFGGDGGPATSATLYRPYGVALDVRGNLFIADSGSSRIRRVDALSGTINNVAGNGTFGFSGDDGPAVSASLNYPFGVTVNSFGKLLIADAYNNRVRSVDPFPWAAVLPARLNFGKRTLGTTSEKMEVTLTNTGYATLAVLSFAITGPNSGDFALSDNCGRYMEAGANCSISVAFKPSVIGLRTATISIINNAPDNPQTVSLIGFGAGPAGASPLKLTPGN